MLPEGIALAAVGEREDPRDALVGRGPIAWSELAAGRYGRHQQSSPAGPAAPCPARPPGQRHPRQRGHPTRPSSTGGRSGPRSCSLRRGSSGSAWATGSASGCLGGDAAGTGTGRAGGDGAGGRRRVRSRRRAPRSTTGRPRSPSRAERAFLRRMEGGCQVPVAALAVLADGALRLHGRVVSLDGEPPVEGRGIRHRMHEVADAEELGTALAERLLEEGAAEILAEVRAAHASVRHRAVMPARSWSRRRAGTFPGLGEALRCAFGRGGGNSPAHLRAARSTGTAVDRAIRESGAVRRGRVHVAPRRAPHSADAGTQIGRDVAPAGLGRGSRTAAALTTARERRAHGSRATRSARSGAAAAAGARRCCERECAGPVLFPCGEIRRDELPTRLRQEGIEVDEVVCYRSVLAGESRRARAAVRRAGILVVASPTVAELLARASAPDAATAAARGGTDDRGRRARRPDGRLPPWPSTPDGGCAGGRGAHAPRRARRPDERSLPARLPARAGGAAAGVDDAPGRPLSARVSRGARPRRLPDHGPHAGAGRAR